MANRLIHEQSPYLLQHANNPVDWYAWGDEPFARAAQEHKPVLISIGYAACHWCHVMEHESFENEEVAAYMNAHFICVKVDREEHPDVDHMYMDAVQALGGSGGWPLNVFATPERAPFYGGTYFPPRPAYGRLSWMQLLQRINEIWTEQQDEVALQAQQMLAHLQQASLTGINAKGSDWDMAACSAMADALLQQADTVYGGFGKAPKFPGTMAISYLLEHYHFTGSKPARDQALLSLDAMIEGGIYDQLGGGFARYSTDEKWLAPHFEKMLYDNALLIRSMCDAYSLTHMEKYKKAIVETIAFIERELKDNSGGFYSALDADSEGVEGKFYTWTWAEWQEATNGGDPIAEMYFGITREGNWEHTNILHVAVPVATIAKDTGRREEEIIAHIETIKKRLLEIRGQRIRPQTDDKSLLSWNALMNLALAQAAKTLQSKEYQLMAEEHMHWMLQCFIKEGELMHTWKNGTARIDAHLDDYAYLIQALLQLATGSGDVFLIKEAEKWIDVVMQRFVHEDGSFFYYTSSAQQEIPVRKVDMYDGATPSANAVMAHNLLIAGMCLENNKWTEQGYYMLQQMNNTATRYTSSFSYWALIMQRYAKGLKTIVCTGNNAINMGLELSAHFLPNCYIVTSEKEISDIPILEDRLFKGENYIFVCTQQACLSPVSNAREALQLLTQ
ncbi:MAG: thioredoxin domain-containing protein [Taibaiella sp.]|nr:thioredoxin domain-containing protein [Taibaiella sp.]